MDAVMREKGAEVREAGAAAREDALWVTVMWAGVGVAAFEGAFAYSWLGFLMGVFLFAVVQVSFAKTARLAFYVTFLMMGVGYGARLGFFWGIFGVGAVALWGFLAIWVAGFVLIVRGLRGILPRWAWTICLPVVWTGMEYFRCEWNPLRFSWLTPGMAVGHWWGLHVLGVYGTGMGMMGCAAVVACGHWKKVLPFAAVLGGVLMAVVVCAVWGGSRIDDAGPRVRFVGIQLEQAAPEEIVRALDNAVAAHPEAAMFVLGEYALTEGPPVVITNWAREHGKYVLIGGMDFVAGKDGDANNYYDTAFVIGPAGKVVFTQAKAVPIQVMKDGLAAKEQRVWDSPWGTIGICICYDLSYRRVTDELIRQGAQVLVVPTMDAASWGAAEHELHARVAPVRAAEYGVPVFRVTTSGISQSVGADGDVVASAPFPGQGEMMASEVRFARAPGIPVDQYVGPWAAVVTAGAAGWMLVLKVLRRFVGARKPNTK